MWGLNGLIDRGQQANEREAECGLCTTPRFDLARAGRSAQPGFRLGHSQPQLNIHPIAFSSLILGTFPSKLRVTAHYLLVPRLLACSTLVGRFLVNRKEERRAINSEANQTQVITRISQLGTNPEARVPLRACAATKRRVTPPPPSSPRHPGLNARVLTHQGLPRTRYKINTNTFTLNKNPNL